jgi:hypothetical protein
MFATVYNLAADASPSRLLGHFGRILQGIREGRAIEARYHQLSQLSRSDLARHGLTREQAARIALTDVYGANALNGH